MIHEVRKTNSWQRFDREDLLHPFFELAEAEGFGRVRSANTSYDTIPAGQRLQTYYPPNDGFLGDRARQTLRPGTVVDR